MDPTLESYIREARAAGKSEAQIRTELYEQGWPEHVADEALTGRAASSQTGELKPFGELFTQTRRSYGYLFRIFWPVFALLFVLQVVPSFLPGGASAAVVLQGAVWLAALVLTMLLPIAMILALDQRERANPTPNLVGLWREARSKFWGFVWVGMVSTLVVMGGFVALVVPGLVLSIQNFFASYIYVLEGRRGLAAVETSRQMVRGLGWPVFGRLFLMGLMAMAVFLVVVVITVLLAIPAFIHITPGSAPYPSPEPKLTPMQEAAVNGLQGLANLFLFPVFAAFPYWLYREVRRLRGAPEVQQPSQSTKVFLGLGIAGVAVFLAAFLSVIALAIRKFIG
ncbi:hypothetical protein HYZ80_02790 [Candidatus Parcubacteria bacterium]|nr:hypothetical protein [Candidatus Parcubacteria bacterium]